MKLNCVIIDDEYLAISILEAYCSRIASVTLSGKFKNPLDAQVFLQKNEVDVLLLDIQMPYMTGIELVKKLPYKPMVIFTTARHEFAVQAFELNVLDYLVKPISFERFENAIERAMDYQQLRLAGTEWPGHLFIKSDHRTIRLLFDEIVMIEGLSEYVKVHTKDRRIITLAALKDLETQLPADRFVRIHKSYIVSQHYIHSFTHARVTMSNALQLPVGRVYKESFLAHMRKGLDKAG